MTQLSMFGTAQPTRDDYYVAMSAMQKLIRRGYGDAAAAQVDVVYRYDKQALKRRLLTAMLEDVGLGDWDVVSEQGARVVAGGLKLVGYQAVARELAGAIKNRDAQCIGAVRRQHGETFPELRARAELQALRATGPQAREYFADPPSHPKISVLRQVFASRVPGFAVALARLIEARESDVMSGPPTTVCTDVVVGWWDEGRAVPMCALDGHTRGGKRVVAQLARELGLSDDRVARWLFHREGALVDRRVAWTNDYATALWDRAALPVPDSKAFARLRQLRAELRE